MPGKMVIGIFEDYHTAAQVIEALKNADFKPADISILGSDPDELRLVAAEADVEAKGADRVVTTCGALGAVGGWLVGLAALAVPGAGPLLAAGPLMAALSGAAAGGIIGVITGALLHFDVPEYEAKVYAGHLTAGKVLVGVHTEDHDSRVRAEDIMEEFDAIEIDMKAEPEAGKVKA
jgi:hypothetical protein